MVKWLFLLVYGCSLVAMAKEYPKSDHFDGKHFYNLYVSQDKEIGFWGFWKWRLFESGNENAWPLFVNNTAKPQLADKVNEQEAYITYINHSTELIQLPNLNILTDPIFSERASPVSWYGPKRVHKPGLTIEELPRIDIVIISHNHYDHMDLPSIKALAAKDNPLFIVPLKNQEILKKADVEKVVELDWWQNYAINNHQSITLLPSQHWSKRTLFNKNEALWGSYFISSETLKIVFLGDTGWGPHINDIYQRVGEADIAIIPIGSYEPRWFMKVNHLNPEEAVKVHLALKSKLSMAIHFGTFRLSNESYDAPVQDLNKALKTYNVDDKKFIVPEVGQTIHFQKLIK